MEYTCMIHFLDPCYNRKLTRGGRVGRESQGKFFLENATINLCFKIWQNTTFLVSSSLLNALPPPPRKKAVLSSIPCSVVNYWIPVRRQNSRPQQTFERWTPTTHESPRGLGRQSEAKRKQAPQSEANVCRHKCNLKKTSLINCTRHPIMHRTPNRN